MKTFDLKASLRKSTGKKDAKALRRNKQVPCVLYGGKENIHFSAEERAFKDLVYTHHAYVVNLDIEGSAHLAVMKEIQFHPVTDTLNHVDFVEVAARNPIIIDLPVEITGNSVGIRSGGKLRQRKRYIKVKGIIEKLPDLLTVDISDLDIGDSILAGDLNFQNVQVLESPRSLVVGVISARAAAKGMGEEGVEGAAPAAGTAAEGAAAAPAGAPAATAEKAEKPEKAEKK
ncbi:MAG TPA: 50S ribosomal protein L25 [Bacteroidales bacterium]|jgi:large subunit ribosomal protein L25|nr:50S ribosomal protein L25 [Bacteroidales bacterium]